MTNLVNLPEELLSSVADNLGLDHLRNLRLSCRTIQEKTSYSFGTAYCKSRRDNLERIAFNYAERVLHNYGESIPILRPHIRFPAISQSFRHCNTHDTYFAPHTRKLELSACDEGWEALYDSLDTERTMKVTRTLTSYLQPFQKLECLELNLHRNPLEADSSLLNTTLSTVLSALSRNGIRLSRLAINITSCGELNLRPIQESIYPLECLETLRAIPTVALFLKCSLGDSPRTIIRQKRVWGYVKELVSLAPNVQEPHVCPETEDDELRLRNFLEEFLAPIPVIPQLRKLTIESAQIRVSWLEDFLRDHSSTLQSLHLTNLFLCNAGYRPLVNVIRDELPKLTELTIMDIEMDHAYMSFFWPSLFPGDSYVAYGLEDSDNGSLFEVAVKRFGFRNALKQLVEGCGEYFDDPMCMSWFLYD
ncbi:uncharacterized protein K452DRAFT_346994 [Aplosporella prunicola CBS 121167]|uniref:F-box domain-containing protein n=1 Tax=Aplosporella prunicola CBS 121167 TaxID=1176127 RepID=A0A6A6BK50_9PEZI|nr:uncharacterized protein K452DRAFT_346994 [Aplosporella prunicola CBS 121167]KAF2143207.1 hypothetical protein K452DRAFT_346994 [Aplosporella prunicola CBS 121167]